MVAEPAPAPRISEQDAKAMVDSLVSAATGAAMLDLPPTIYLAMAQNLAREKAKVAAALMTPNVFYPDPASIARSEPLRFAYRSAIFRDFHPIILAICTSS